MKRFLAILLALSGCAYGQTNLTVVSDTNRAIRTNFTIGNAQVTGLSGLLDGKLATNGNASALTNITAANVVGTVATASNITGILAISNGGTGSSSASNARTALGLGTAATNAASAFQAASANLTNLAANDGGALTNLNAQNFLPEYSNNVGKVLSVATGGTNIEWIAISNTVTDGSSITNLPLSNTVGTLSVVRGGTGATNASDARINLLPAYTNNASKVLALNTNATDVEWITITNSGGGTSGVTSVNVSGGSTGLTTSGGPITNSGTITLGGTLSIAAGGTGQTNAAAAIEALLPAYSNNATKVLALNSNATSLEWVTNGTGGGGSGTVTSVDASGGSTGMSFTGGPITTNGTLTLGGTLAIANGGTGAGSVSNARVNLLPSYSGNAGKALVLNTNGTDLEWATVATTPVGIANGGTGATNTTNALINLTILNTNNGVRIGPSSLAISGVAIGNSARAQSTNGTDGANGVAIGGSAYASTNGVSVGHNAGSVSGVAIGSGALTGAEAIAVGKNSAAEPGIAIGTGAGAYEVGAIALGDSARADNTNSIQIGTGTNSTDNAIQVRGWGLVASNSWGALANSTTIGREIMQAPTNGTNGQVLIWTNNDVAWAAGGGGGGLPETPLAISNGGSGASTAAGALTNFGVLTDNGGGTVGVFVATPSANVTGSSSQIAIGRAVVVSNSANSVVIGQTAASRGGSVNIAIGSAAVVSNAANAIQLGDGLNSTSTTMQFRSGGTVNETEWGYLANASTAGGLIMTSSTAAAQRTNIGLPLAALTNTANNTMMRALSGSTNTNHPFSGTVSVVGTNNTNTLVFSNGILQEVQ